MAGTKQNCKSISCQVPRFGSCEGDMGPWDSPTSQNPYEEWLQSSDTEKENVIVRWKLIHEHLMKKANPEEMMRNVLEAHRNKRVGNGEVHQETGSTASHAQPVDRLRNSARSPEDAMLAVDGNSHFSLPHDESLMATGTSDTTQPKT
ncbi:hypothetical protein NW762_012435 [Fusarium torreyae]|uniref:Uncharacterized protein n=1 Tax=Fusarium torreyae TaxID=1237075 RepID=A0A9W8RQI2_9HYPO|nr:hypothetical protein NW762_012435 [Fusarium torreyae]